MTESSNDSKPTSENTGTPSGRSGGETRLYAALGILAVLGGALYFQTETKKDDIKAHTVQGEAESLPKLSFTEEQKAKVTKIVIEKPASAKEGEEAAPAQKFVLVKDGDNWQLEEPQRALANKSNVESLLNSLPKLAVKERITKDAASYGQYDLGDDKALHVTVFEGETSTLELWAGKSGGRGQMARLKGQDGVYVIDGYSSYLFGRDTKGWRDLSVLKVDTDKATLVNITNEHGEFELKKDGSAWTGKFKKAKGGALAPIQDFDSAKVEDLLRAYKALNASGFGDGKSLADAGLEKPLARIVITAGDSKTELAYGSTAEGSSRYAKVPSSAEIVTISSWAADWAVAEESKFQKKKEAAEP
jgi:Domain of unknown function (DUF4340)